MNIQTQKTLLLFGGEDHKTFLGCLNCGLYNETSVCNQYGTFGSKYNPFCPWNAYSTTAPIIVDEQGGSYGYFSVNKYHHDLTRIEWLVEILDFYIENDDLEMTRDKMCGR